VADPAAARRIWRPDSTAARASTRYDGRPWASFLAISTDASKELLVSAHE
jgi:hypothetical protein